MGDGGRAFGYVGALDGLRAFAVLSVLLFHADLGVAHGGFLGVSVFFTLSGFLITSLLLREHQATGRVDLRAFYERRVRRLMPAAHLCVAAVLAAGVWWGAAQRRALPGDAIAAVANVANWRFALAGQSYQDLFIGLPSPLAHFWSLAIEEQCYLLLPVVAAWAMRRGGSRPLGVLLTAMVAGSLVATLLTDDTNLVYNATHTRAGELLIGAVAAVVAVHLRPGRRTAAWASGLGLLVLGLLVAGANLQQHWLYRGGFLLVAVVSATTVVGLTGSHRVSRLVGSRPFTAVGRRSYGVYLYHWPLFLLLTPERVGVDGWALFGVRLAATAAVTVCSYALLEQPVRRGRVLRGRRVLAGTVSLAAVAVAVAAVVAVPAPNFTRTEELLALGDGGPITFSRDGVQPASAGMAVPGLRTGPARVLVVGSNSTPVAALRDAGFEVTDGTRANCPVGGGAEVRMQDGTLVDVSACGPVLDHWTNLLHDTSPDAVVLSVGDIDAGLTRMSTDFGFPAHDDVQGTARLLAATEQSMRRVVAALDTSEVPVVFFDTVVLGGERPVARLALGSSPPRQVQHTLEGLVAAVGEATGDEADVDHRVLVVGDSTSLNMAQAISDAGAGRVAVQWAGANGCPFVRTEATRASSSMAWEEGRCPDYAATVPGLVAQFRPDVVMVVLGPTELQEQRYPGDPSAHVAGDPAFVTAHDAAMASFLGAVGDVPVLVTDGPALQTGVWATPEMAHPQRVGAWNLQVARWDMASPQIFTLPYAAALATYEWAHGAIRADGVHPDVRQLTTLVGEWLMPFLDAIAGSWGTVGGGAPEQGAGSGIARARLLVIGDSTSLMAARALADGSAGSLVVRWAGQEGCPLVPAAAARPARDSPWRELNCTDPVSALPKVIEEFAPDAVLVVLGAMELMELRAADGTSMLPGDAAYRAAHDKALAALLRVAQAGGTRLVFADSPPLGVGSFSTFEMADPARARRFNAMLAEWDRDHDDVSVLSYGGPITRYEAEHGSIRPDGSHPLVEPLTGIARDELVPSLVALLDPRG